MRINFFKNFTDKSSGDSVAESDTPSETTRTGTESASFNPATTFLTPAEIEDHAVRLAMSGIPLEQGIGNFERARETKLEALEAECRSRKAILSKRVAELNERIEEYKNQLREFRETKAELRNTKFKIDVAIQTLHLKMATIRLEARVKQLEAEKTFFDDETRKLTEKEEEIRLQITKDKENELVYARQLHSSLLEVWQTDEAELNRRAELLKDEYQNTQDLLKPLQQKIKYLRQIGITRTTAGFLLWAGYTAFAGVGSLIGSLLQQRQKDPREADLLGNFIRGFAEFFGLSQSSTFSWWPFLKMLSFVGVALVFLVLITILCDILLRRFSNRWRRSHVQNNPRPQVGKSTQSWKEFVGLLTTGSDRLALFTGKIARSDYVQLLAVIPYVVLAAILMFLLSALGLTIPIPKSSLSATITSASIGAVFTLMSTSVCLLYATKVIEPRWERLINEPNPGRWAYIKANWEFGALMFVMAAVVLLLTFLPLQDPHNYWTWGLVALFMTVGSIGLAYGLIYRGIFRDYDYLGRRSDSYLFKVEEHVLKPTLSDVFAATDTQELEDAAERYRKAREYLDGLRIENELSGLFGEDHPEYDSTFSRFWFSDLDLDDSRADLFDLSQRGRRKLYRLIRRFDWRRSTPPPPKAWGRAAPEAMEHLQAHQEEIARYQEQLREIDGQINKLDQDHVVMEAKVETTRQDLRTEETQLSSVERECATQVREHNLQRQKEEIIFTSAFLTGRIVYDYLSKDSPKTSQEGAGV